MSASKIMRVYLALSAVLGLLLTALSVLLLKRGDIELNAALLLPLCWNVLFMLILPLVLDWSEQKYLKARFVQLEEVAKDNPELMACLNQQCEKLAVDNIRLAVVDSAAEEAPFSYGLLRYNPRVILPSSMLRLEDKSKMIPSIENELNRFARQEINLYFLAFTVVEIGIQQLLFHFI
ncbi:MAG: hypothetical protein K2X27_23595 [Candidatus Obscuribacterales bacterium]|nr:hypothetical protein [Candidatus Obscuribacterales bacterium]